LIDNYYLRLAKHLPAM